MTDAAVRYALDDARQMVNVRALLPHRHIVYVSGVSPTVEIQCFRASER